MQRGVLAGGNSITLTGTEFDSVTQVRVGDNPPTAYTVNSPTSMTVTVPPGEAGTVKAQSMQRNLGAIANFFLWAAGAEAEGGAPLRLAHALGPVRP